MVPAAAETGPHRIELPQWLSLAPLEQLLGMEIITTDQGQAVLELPFYRQFAQGAGLLHGGVLLSLADTALALACKTLLEPGTHFVTARQESRFLAPVTQGRVQARAQVDSFEKRTLLGSCCIYRLVDNQPVLDFQATFKIPRPR